MANKKKFYGKRMVPEYLITKLETLEPSSDYTAGTGIDIEDNEISIDDTVVATKTDLEDYELKSEAFSGSYNDLTDKPTIPAAQVQSDWSQSDNTKVDYIKNKPTIPDAVSGTNDGTNWTSLTIGNDTYGLASGGGSVDIDNKTIIENLDGELETAIGGWKETITYNFTPNLPATSIDWDLVDSSLANQMFNALEINTQYDVTLKFYNGDTEVQPTYPITESYIRATSKTISKFGGSQTLYIISNSQTIKWEFYVDISSNKIHVWPGQSLPGITPSSTTSLQITIEPITTIVYHKLDTNYLPDGILTQANTGKYGITYNSNEGKLALDIFTDDNIYDGLRTWWYSGNTRLGFTVKNDPETIEFTNGWYNGMNTTIIGGGYKANYTVDASLVSNTSDKSQRGTTTQSDIINALSNCIIAEIKKQTLPTPGTNKSFTKSNFFKTKYGNATTDATLAVTFTLNTVDNNIVEVSYNNSNYSLTTDAFTFKLDTEEITSSATKVYMTSSLANNFINNSGGNIIVSLPRETKIVKQVDKKFIPLVSDIPSAPTTQGAYKLRCTVDANGIPTYTWEADV